MRRALPVLTLFVLAPLIAEVTIGDLPFDAKGAVAGLFTLPIYGAGALLVREVVRRRGGGWASILLLGAAFGLVEEGLALQSLFSATIYGGIGPALGARLLGINGVYTELQVVNHAVWSVAVPILLTELVFRGRRGRPFLGRFGLVVTGLVYLLGVGLLMLSAHTQLAPGYWAPVGLLAGTALVVAVLVVVALGALPSARSRAPRASTAPAPWVVFVSTLVGASAFLAVLVLPGHARLAFARGPGVLLPVLVALAVVVVLGRSVGRWSAATGWGDRHALALGAGALLGHTLVWGLTQPTTWTDRAGVAVLLVLTVVLLAVLRRGLARSVGPKGSPTGVS